MKLKKSIAILLALSFLACVAIGCGSSSSGSTYSSKSAASYETSSPYYYEEDSEDYALSEPTANSGSSLGGLGEAKLVENDRKLIYTCNYDIETKAFETDYMAILTAIDEAGGFLSNENTYGTKPEEYGDRGRTSHLTLRIPVSTFDTFLNSLEGIGSITSKNRSTEDVTTSYYDNEARIELYETHYNKLMEYLANATEMSDIIALESEMTEVLYQLDQLKGNKRHMDDRISYCTVTITLEEVVEYTEVVVSRQTFGERVIENLSEVTIGLVSFLQELAIFLISSSPVFAFLGIVFAAIFIPIHFAVKKKKAKKAAAGTTAPVAPAQKPQQK